MKNLFDQVSTFLSQIFSATIFKIGDTELSISLIVRLILALIILIIITRAFQNFLKTRLLVRMGIYEGNRETIATIISYSFSTIGLIVVLQTTGVNLASLAVIAGGLGVGIGFGLQDITKNFVSGLTLLIERTLKVGDFVEFDGLQGYVKSISIRSTIIYTKSGADVVVPNSQLVENRLLNWSYESFVGRIKIPVGVDYGTDTVLLTECLLNAAYIQPGVIHNPAPKVNFIEFGESSLNFELRVWVNRIDDEEDIKSSLNFIIEYNLRHHGINIPSPQRELSIKNPELSITLNRPVKKDANIVELEKEPDSVAKKISIRDLLRQVTYFQNLTDLELRQFIEVGYRRRLSASEILFRENDPGDAFYIILSGAVEVYVEKINKYLSKLTTGQFFGELSLMLGIPRTATVRALEDTVLFVINNKGFEKMLQQYPDLSEVIVQELGKYQEELSERQRQLRALGLVDADEDDKNPVVWVRKRLKNLFAL